MQEPHRSHFQKHDTRSTLKRHPLNNPAGVSSIPQRLSDKNTAAIAGSHSEQRSPFFFSNNSLFRVKIKDQEDANVELSLVCLQFESPTCFSLTGSITICIR